MMRQSFGSSSAHGYGVGGGGGVSVRGVWAAGCGGRWVRVAVGVAAGILPVGVSVGNGSTTGNDSIGDSSSTSPCAGYLAYPSNISAIKLGIQTSPK